MMMDNVIILEGIILSVPFRKAGELLVFQMQHDLANEKYHGKQLRFAVEVEPALLAQCSSWLMKGCGIRVVGYLDQYYLEKIDETSFSFFHARHIEQSFHLSVSPQQNCAAVELIETEESF